MRAYTRSCTVKNIMVFCIIAFMPICSIAQDASQSEVRVMNLLNKYSLRYEARENSIETLVSFFTSDLSSIYDLNLKTKSRFTSRLLSRLLDAPIVIQKNRSVLVVDCVELDIEADACAVIEGQALLAGETSWEDIPKKIVLGFTEVESRYLISYVQNGATDDSYFSVWPSDQK